MVRLGPTWALYIETLGNSISWQGTCQLLQFTLGNCVEVTVTKEGILGPSQHPSSISDLYLWFLLYDHEDMRSPPIGTMLYREMVSIKKKKKDRTVHKGELSTRCLELEKKSIKLMDRN